MSYRLLSWAGCITYIVGMLLTAFNVYPVYLWFQVAGGVIWCFASARTKDLALFVNELMAVVSYSLGFAYFYVPGLRENVEQILRGIAAAVR